MGYSNSETDYDDLVYPEHSYTQKQKLKKPTKLLVYCTSYACNPPKNTRSGDSYLKERIIKDPPKSGWCPYCGCHLFYENRAILPVE